MHKTARGILVAVAMSLAATAVEAQTQIKVSYQPALYWSLPYYVATEKGWWGKVGMKESYSTFPAGVPQIAASASGSWDVGGTGSVPAVLGAARYHLLTIGITNDESAGNALMATKDTAAAYEKNPRSIKGKTIALTANSTGDYAVQKCLAKWGLKKADVTMKSMGQAEVISAMSSDQVTLGGLWAPNIYTLEEKAGAKVICSGKDAGAVVPGALVVREEYAKEHPKDVAKYLAVYLHSWKWIQAHRKESIAMMKKFYEIGGVTISEASMEKEFDTRPVFDLEQQLAIMDRSRGASKVDHWMNAISEFLKQVGTIQKVQPASEYVSDTYMKMVAADPKLKAFADSSAD